MVQPLWKGAWKFLIKLNIHPPFDLEIPLLYIYQGETKTRPQKDLYANSGFSSNRQKLETTQMSIDR